MKKPLLIALVLAGCSSQQLYETGRNYQQNRCVNLPQTMAKDCLQQNGMDYDTYRREAEKAK